MLELSTPAFGVLHDIVGNGHRADRHAWMNEPHSRNKYSILKGCVSDANLGLHLRGLMTFAAPLIGRDGLVSAAAIDLDIDGLDGARRVLEAAERRGVVAWAIVVRGSGDHDGSHTWVLFAERVRPESARELARQIAEDAGYADAETWPSSQVIRLPFGVHRHSERRGRLILQSGEFFDLDEAGQFEAGSAAVAALPLNSARLLEAYAGRDGSAAVVDGRALEGRNTDPGRRGSPLPAVAEAAERGSPITRFNATHSIEALLAQYGGTQTQGGWSCNCGEAHTHETQLAVTDRGKLVSYSNHCKWAPHYTSGRAQDAFGLYTLVEHGGDHKAAARAFYNEERKARRHEETRAALDELRSHVARLDLASVVPAGVDAAKHSERAHLLFSYLLGEAENAESMQVHPTNQRICEALGLCERYVQYAFRELEAAGLGKRSGGVGGSGGPSKAASWTFAKLRVHDSREAEEHNARPEEAAAHVERGEDAHAPYPENACEGGPSSGIIPDAPREAAALEPPFALGATPLTSQASAEAGRTVELYAEAVDGDARALVADSAVTRGANDDPPDDEWADVREWLESPEGQRMLARCGPRETVNPVIFARVDPIASGHTLPPPVWDADGATSGQLELGLFDDKSGIPEVSGEQGVGGEAAAGAEARPLYLPAVPQEVCHPGAPPNLRAAWAGTAHGSTGSLPLLPRATTRHKEVTNNEPVPGGTEGNPPDLRGSREPP